METLETGFRKKQATQYDQNLIGAAIVLKKFADDETINPLTDRPCGFVDDEWSNLCYGLKAAPAGKRQNFVLTCRFIIELEELVYPS